MPFSRSAYLRFLFLLLPLLICTRAISQSSVWNEQSIKKSASSKTAKAKKKVKGYKDHLFRWGLDTNYRHELLLGGKLNSDGWSGSIFYLRRKSATVNNVWQLSFSEIKHEKQIKQKAGTSAYPKLGKPTAYVFGKINNLYTLQIGFGKEKLLLPAVLEGNLSVSLRYGGGFSLAMLKPYYLKLAYADDSNNTTVQQEKYNHEDSAKFLNRNFILGASKWGKGLDEITYVPGAYLEASIAIQPGKNKAFIQVITLGINAAAYTRSLPIMADQKAFPWQASLFAGLAVGTRCK